MSQFRQFQIKSKWHLVSFTLGTGECVTFDISKNRDIIEITQHINNIFVQSTQLAAYPKRRRCFAFASRRTEKMKKSSALHQTFKLRLIISRER